MALFGKDLKETLGKVKDKVGEVSKDISAQTKEHKEKSNEAKAPVEGSIARYEVTYIGGLPQLPKKKTGAIGLNIMPDRFILKPTITALDFFELMEIPYDSISKFELDKRTVSNAEMLLSSSSSDMKSLEQENNINITYTAEDGSEIMLRVEMLTGVSVYGQAGKCREMLDVLRNNKILDKLNKTTEAAPQQVQESPIDQIKKLSELKDLGVISEEEFNQKKAELLAKL